MQQDKLFTIFIVEDDPFYGALLQQYLMGKAHEVQLFPNCNDLIFELHRNPDMILLDYNLGGSKNGLEVLREIKGVNPDIPVIFLTGQESIEVAVSSLKYGAFDYVEKNDDTFLKLDRILDKITDLPDLLDNDVPGAFGIANGLKKVLSRIIPALLSLLLISACSGPRILVPDAGMLAAQEIQTTFGEQQHRIQTDDKLALSIWNHDDLSVGSLFGIYNSNEVYGKWVLVNKDGTAVFPAIGTIHIAGLTTNEAADTLAARYAVLIKNPVVVVKVLNMQVTVLGEVKTPGVYTLEKENNSLFEMLGRAGGTAYYADHRKVTVMRGNPQHPDVHTIDLRKIKNLENPAVLLQSGDIVYVPPRQRQRFDKEVGTYVGVGSIITSLAVLISSVL